jgi:serine/threonine protein kinase
MVIDHNKGYDYVGTVVNSAPEALNNNVEKTPNKIDIWSLGCLIFKLCTREQIAPYDIMNDQELLGNYYKELP